ncbi:hypothetical protein NPX13_g8181 [Xylaria arbuscula]|uniref:Peptidase C19 ubiquitin carboxyl-terminal hydrolase domain-containing protein n=1 Tax=Xylaria arbuscula TaxID=114810 RepID=A0A9W8TIK6_9PEZI|nr:hypothetical protein NPX13_g8181 [Xylaria arbuscula]
MKTSGLPKKFLSRREKNGHRRAKSSDTTHKHRPLSSEILSIFKFESARHHAKDEDEATQREKESEKMKEVHEEAAKLGLDLHNLDDSHIASVLNSSYASMDVARTIEILGYLQASIEGRILAYNPAVHMVGAVNRGNVTCYLDSLLFAMFAKLEPFECMLKADIRDDEPRRKLAVLLRVWVNLLRRGKLIETNLKTEQIQETLAECGWDGARLLEQQDTSEAFAFITETLQLPLLPLRVDLFHHGKNDDADHKVVYERLLNLAVPSESEGKDVKLEDCLEEYFNSKVDVLREGSDEKKAGEAFDQTPTPTQLDGPSTPRSAIHVIETASGENASVYTQSPVTTPVASNPHTASASHSLSRPNRNRAESIIQRVVINNQDQGSDADTAELFPRAKRKSSVVKAVTIPAWQFFKMIPWHSSTNSEPKSDLEVARHFSQRPVVGICLKRYMMDNNGVMKRQNTYIDIPDSLRLPHFIMDERRVEEAGLTADYKLVLQRHDADPPPDYEEAQWVKFDDLSDERVSGISNIKAALKQEMPYLLFYQIIPIVDVAPSSVGSFEADPPAYEDGTPAAVSIDVPGYQEYQMVSRKTSSYFDNSSSIPSVTPSVRFSTELEPRARPSFTDEDGFLSVSRRGSIAIGELAGSSSGIASNDHSPAVTPAEETTAQRFSRAAAKFRSSNRSRPQSQAGEHRISLTMSRFGFGRSSKEPLRDSSYETTDDETDIVIVNGVEDDQEEKDGSVLPLSKGKDKDKESTQKRDKSKTRFEKRKSKDKDFPDRECIVQ